MTSGTPRARTAPEHATTPEHPRRFGRRFLSLFALGVIGLIALVPTMRDMVEPAVRETGLSPTLLLLLTMLQPLLLLAGAVGVGILLAARLRLRSRIADAAAGSSGPWRGFWLEVRVAMFIGVGAALVMVGLDLAARPLMSPEWQRVLGQAERDATITIAGILYGGLTEELLTRWGLLTLLAWIPWRLLRASERPPRAAIMWWAVLASALLFGTGHLQAAAALHPLDAAIIVRTVALNALGGIAFGLLYWRYSLEAAMIAHAMTHVALTAIVPFVPGVPGA